jgi:HD-like signal output (HDOD) protein
MSVEAMQTAASFVQQLAGDLNSGDLELPMFSGTAVRIQRAFQVDEVNIDEVERMISSDPAIAARVLELANSAAIRGNRQITDLRQAVIRMGDKLVQSSVLTFALRQVERNEGLSKDSKAALRAIWIESIELAARCHVIAKEYTKLNANEALLAGLLSVVGRLYIILKSQEYGLEDDADLEQVLAEWHPAICKAIAESWNMSEDLVSALELQLETDPPLQENATLAEVLCAARLILQHDRASESLDASDYPLLQRLGIANHGDTSVTLAEHAETLDNIRKGLIA